MSAQRLNSTIVGLLAMQPQGSMLPDVRFFHPKKHFFDWMNRHCADTHIYDVGAGCGHVTKALLEKGLCHITAIDISYRDGEEEAIVAIGNGVSWTYQQGSTVMLCRPCHGFFTQAVVERAMDCRAKSILYIGLPKNAGADLGAYRRMFKTMATRVGQDGENIYQFDL